MARSLNNPSPLAKVNDPMGQNDYAQDSEHTDLARLKAELEGMKRLPWNDIWRSLRVARMRGHDRMIEVFFATLFKDAVFDDRGAWSIESRKPH